MTGGLDERVTKALRRAAFFMLRYETQYTPCTGITAVSIQERRYFSEGVTIAPWCPKMKEARKAVTQKKVLKAGRFALGDGVCEVRLTSDEFAPVVYLEIKGRFAGRADPYDTPDLQQDALVFGLAIEGLLQAAGASKHQFVWGSDWQTVPALVLLRDRHHLALTLHNTFDKCLAPEARAYGGKYGKLMETRMFGGGEKTALEVGLEVADVVTTVNRGFAYGMRTEKLQREVLAKQLQHLVGRVVGIDNASFNPLNEKLRQLKQLLAADLQAGAAELQRLKSEALSRLPAEVREKGQGKAIVVTMGRRVSQKQHDVLVESVRRILTADREFPVLVFFATTPGDAGGDARLEEMRKLEREFPASVVCTEDRLPYYQDLMGAADFNCMPSLYEPHGGAYAGTVVPIARAVDGLAEQICGLGPEGRAAELNTVWHAADEPPTGFLFREPDEKETFDDLTALLNISPSPHNALFEAMVEALTPVLRQAVEVRLRDGEVYARLVLAVLERVELQRWHVNLGGMLSLVEEARTKRPL